MFTNFSEPLLAKNLFGFTLHARSETDSRACPPWYAAADVAGLTSNVHAAIEHGDAV
jgi:hypothetical protein